MKKLSSLIITLSALSAAIIQSANAAPAQWVKGTCSDNIADSLPTYYARCIASWIKTQDGRKAVKAIKITPGMPYKNLYFEDGKNADSARDSNCLYVTNGPNSYGICMLIDERGQPVQMFSDNPYWPLVFRVIIQTILAMLETLIIQKASGFIVFITTLIALVYKATIWYRIALVILFAVVYPIGGSKMHFRHYLWIPELLFMGYVFLAGILVSRDVSTADCQASRKQLVAVATR